MAHAADQPPLVTRTRSMQHLQFIRLSSDELGERREKPMPLLSCRHWLEVEDHRHRYGTYLRPYYEAWRALCIPQPFFTWLDEGDGASIHLSPGHLCDSTVNAKHIVSRAQLDRSDVRYCDEEARLQFLIELGADGRLFWQSTGLLVDTTQDDFRWIFVIDRQGRMYVNRKMKGVFHHTSFVAGAPVRAAGRLSVREGRVLFIGPQSGHYKTSMPHLLRAVYGFFGECVLPFLTLDAACDKPASPTV